MKKWTNAEITELNINETENGFFNYEVESPLNILTNDSKKVTPDPKPTPTPTPTPTPDPVDPVDNFSA